MASGISQPEFGQRLRALRVARGLSQRDLAVGVVNPSYVSLLESGSRVPTLEVALQIARALGVPLRELAENETVTSDQETMRAGGERLVRELLAQSAADYGDHTAAAERYLHSFREAKDSNMPVAALKYGLALGEILVVQAAHEERYRFTGELVGIAAVTGVPALVTKVDIEHASAARDAGRLTEALDTAKRALRDIVDTELFRSGQHVQLLSILVSVLCDSGRAGDVPPLIDEMLAIAGQIDSPPLSGRAHWTASVAFARIGDRERAVEHLRRASQMLANPSTPLRDWARFARAAASALLDAEADLKEVERFLAGARAAVAASGLPNEAPLLASVEVRYALAADRPEEALALSEQVDESSLMGFELVRFLLAKGRALHKLGKSGEAVGQMRRAARQCDDLAAHQLAAGVWREIDEIRTTVNPA